MLKLKFPRYLPLLAFLNKENFFLSENNYHTTNLLNGCDNIRNILGSLRDGKSRKYARNKSSFLCLKFLYFVNKL